MEKSIKLGEGASIEGTLGAHFDTVKSSPLPVKAKIKKIQLNWQAMQHVNLVLLDVMGIDVIVTDKHVGCYDPEMMRVLGVEPQNLKAIVVKLGYLEPEIRAIAKKSILVLTDGSTNEVFTRLNYKQLPRPMYPFDRDMEWEP